MSQLKTGIKGHVESEVVFSNTAAAVGSGTLQVFGTPCMAALMEKAAMESVQPYLEGNEGTVGIEINLQHLAPSPMGMVIYCDSELKSIDGKILTFEVTCRSRKELLGKGTHKRAIIDNLKFMQKAIEKRK